MKRVTLISCLFLLPGFLAAQTTLVISASGLDKIYDGNTQAVVTLQDNREAGKVFDVHYTDANFDTWDVGVDKPILVSGLYLTGADAGDYSFNSTASTSANITPRPVVGMFTVADKIYDGNNDAIITERLLEGLLPMDTAYVRLVGGTAAFADHNAGMGKTVPGNGFTYNGARGFNYYLDYVSNTTATIFPKPVDIIAVEDIKVYDETTASDETPYTDPPLITGDTGFYWQVFDDKNIGTGKTLYPFGDIEDGNNGNNYIITWVINYDGVILPASSSVHNVSENEFFLAYPSPNNGTFSFEYYSISMEKVELSIIDISGKIILDKEYPMAGYHITDQINIPDKPQGIYFVRLIDGQSISYRKIVVE